MPLLPPAVQASPLRFVGDQPDGLLGPVLRHLERLTRQQVRNPGVPDLRLHQQHQLRSPFPQVAPQPYCEPRIGEVRRIAAVDKPVRAAEGSEQCSVLREFLRHEHEQNMDVTGPRRGVVRVQHVRAPGRHCALAHPAWQEA